MKRTSYLTFRMLSCEITTLGNIPTSYNAVLSISAHNVPIYVFEEI
jgi:hypothetical protein